tara:strand:- start:1177 stop:1389 length:213 start_codon:yes stop_codon:yes gene_type:complete
MSGLQITSLINDTWQVEGYETVWFQGSLEDCLVYKRHQDNANAANAAYDTVRKSVLGKGYKLEQDDEPIS